MRQHLIRLALAAVIAQVPVAPAVVDPQADFAPGVPRASTPGVVPPRIIRQVDPKYTSQAMREGIQGMVTLDAVVGIDGFVEESRVRGSLDAGLDAEAQKALSRWTFKPAVLDGAPTRFVVEVRMEFRLH